MASAMPDNDTPTIPASADAHPDDAEAAATSAMFVFTADKAGMKGVDKQHVHEVVHKMSKDSSFYQKSLRDNEKVEQRVSAMRDKLACLTGGQQLRLQQEADARVAQLEATRDLSRTIVVVDMDMFYAAVEMRDNPALRDVPLAVGGLNMISTTNYAARQFGVRAAMPGFIGKELCPELHFVPVDMEKYARVAAQIRAVFSEYDPNFEAFSLDEACLDLTDYVAKTWQKYISAALEEEEEKTEDEDEQRWATTVSGRAAIAAAVVRELRQKIYDCTQLTASAGIAVNFMLAKICSDMNKPNGQYVLPFTRDRVMNFIRDLPVRKIGGIGKVTEKILSEALNVHTGGELFAQRGKIFHLFTEKTAVWLLQTSLGLRERREKQERKSFSRERTFRSMSDPKQLEDKCLEICKMLANDLEDADKAAKNVTFVYKDTAFARCSRSMTLASAVFTADDLFAIAVELLRRELPLTLRLMGVRAATLVSRPSSSSTAESGSNSTYQYVSALPSTKKRQMVISKFAEHVPDSFATLSSGSGDESSDQGIKRSNMLPIFSRSVNTSSAPEVDRKPCPICGKLLNALNRMEVNAHLDACVLRSSPSKSLSASPLRQTTQKKAKRIGISHAFTTVQPQTVEKKLEEDAKPCPICGILLNTRSSMEVNAHLDACIVRDRSPAPSPKRKKRSAHEMSRGKHENSIDAFFSKKYNG